MHQGFGEIVCGVWVLLEKGKVMVRDGKNEPSVCTYWHDQENLK